MCNKYVFQKRQATLTAFANGREKPFHDMFQRTNKFYLAYMQSEY